MNRRYLILVILFIIMMVVGLVAAKSVWSICDEEANPGCADAAKSQGYWNFAYDDAAPYTTAGLYCCWWERWYKWQKFSSWNNMANTMNLGSSDDMSAGSDIGTGSDSGVETKSFCPSCHPSYDEEDTAALLARSEAYLAKKPWLNEGKNKTQTTGVESVVAETPTQTPMVMTFSEAA